MHPKLISKKQREATQAVAKTLVELTAQIAEMHKTLTEVWKALDALDQKVVALGKLVKSQR